MADREMTEEQLNAEIEKRAKELVEEHAKSTIGPNAGRAMSREHYDNLMLRLGLRPG